MSHSFTSSSDVRPHVRIAPRPHPGVVLFVTLGVTLAGAEAALRLPAVRDALPERRVYYDPAVSIRLDALDRVVREHGRVDVLFVGSSIVRTNIQPLLFDRVVQGETTEAIVSFNTGMLGLWPAGVEMYLERVWLPAVQPRIIVQAVRYPELRATGYALRDQQFFGGVMERGWREDAGWLDRTASWATGRVKLLQYRGILPAELQLWASGRPGRPDQDGRSGIDPRGYEDRLPLLPETRARGLLDDTDAHEDTCAVQGCAVGLSAIRRAQERAASQDAVFVLVNLPEFAGRWRGEGGVWRYRDYLATVQALADEAGFRFIDVTGGNPAHFSDEREFSDYYHMSPLGAERFTRELATALAPVIATERPAGELLPASLHRPLKQQQVWHPDRF